MPLVLFLSIRCPLSLLPSPSRTCQPVSQVCTVCGHVRSSSTGHLGQMQHWSGIFSSIFKYVMIVAEFLEIPWQFWGWSVHRGMVPLHSDHISDQPEYCSIPPPCPLHSGSVCGMSKWTIRIPFVMHYNTVITQKYSVQSYVHILVNANFKTGFKEFSMVNDFGFALQREGWEETARQVRPFFSSFLSDWHHPSLLSVLLLCQQTRQESCPSCQITQQMSDKANSALVGFHYMLYLCWWNMWESKTANSFQLACHHSRTGVVPIAPGRKWFSVLHRERVPWYSRGSCCGGKWSAEKCVHSKLDGSIVPCGFLWKTASNENSFPVTTLKRKGLHYSAARINFHVRLIY